MRPEPRRDWVCRALRSSRWRRLAVMTGHHATNAPGHSAAKGRSPAHLPPIIPPSPLASSDRSDRPISRRLADTHGRPIPSGREKQTQRMTAAVIVNRHPRICVRHPCLGAMQCRAMVEFDVVPTRRFSSRTRLAPRTLRAPARAKPAQNAESPREKFEQSRPITALRRRYSYFERIADHFRLPDLKPAFEPVYASPSAPRAEWPEDAKHSSFIDCGVWT